MKHMSRAPARLGLAALALAFSAAAALAAGGAAPGPPSYLIPAAAGSAVGSGPRVPLSPELAFADASGAMLPLGHFRGRVLVMNFWATWCAPCIKEMTYLDRLQGDLKGEPIEVLPISEDQSGIKAAKAFFARQKITFLHPFADPGGQLAQTLGIQGLPTSLIVDKQGNQVNRLEGPYEWDNPSIVASLRGLIGEQ